MLKHRVLDVAVNEINEKTDIKVGYTLENVGRKVTALLLNVVPKDEKMVAHNASQSIREKLHEFGVNDKKTEALLKKHDEQYLWANIAIVEEQLKK
jgi:plasmid replication initiation protein